MIIFNYAFGRLCVVTNTPLEVYFFMIKEILEDNGLGFLVDGK